MTARALLAVIAASGAAQADPAVPVFTEETAASGFAHSFTGGWEFMVGGGAAVFDCSGDGLPEVFAPGGTSPAALFRNASAPGGPVVLTRVESGLEIDGVSGAYPLDIDGDGVLDLVVLRVGPDRLMRGLGDCRFEDASGAWGFDGLDFWSTAFAATWERGNDWPTLAVGTYIDRTQEAFPWGNCTPNQLYRPDGAGYAAPLPLLPGFCALSILFTDWNRSGTPALRVSNDREYYKGGQEQMWRILPGEPPVLFGRTARAVRRGRRLAAPAHLGDGDRARRPRLRRLSGVLPDQHGRQQAPEAGRDPGGGRPAPRLPRRGLADGRHRAPALYGRRRPPLDRMARAVRRREQRPPVRPVRGEGQRVGHAGFRRGRSEQPPPPAGGRDVHGSRRSRGCRLDAAGPRRSARGPERRRLARHRRGEPERAGAGLA